MSNYLELARGVLKKTAPLFSMKGKTVIHFVSHGCMGQIHEFDWIGVIVGTTYPKFCDGKMYYKVKVLKNKNGYELRDIKISDQTIYKEVPSWYLQDLGGDFYCVYD